MSILFDCFAVIMNRNSTGILLFSLCAALLLTACGGDKIKGEFTSEELSWLVYEKDQTVQFQDSLGKKETLNVVFRTDLEQIKQYFPIEAEVALSDIDSVKSFRIYLLKDAKDFKRYLRIGEVYRSLDLLKPTAEITIGEQQYKNVYTVIEDTMGATKPYIWRALYNKEFGIIEYTNIHNKTFRLK
jgi:hypothetical protein